MQTILLLLISNSFMTYAWYGHLKNPNLKLGQAVLISWGVAFFEYCFMVPANRIGYKTFNAYQLKIIQEVITLSVFVVFAYFFLGEKLRWNYVVSFVFIFLAVIFMFKK
ncbi:MAG: DMT family protein [Chitinophagales bacterium]|nr:DMT family protein [Chitinophagales bacterium]